MTRKRPLSLERWFWNVHSRTWDDELEDPQAAAHVEEIADWIAGVVPAGEAIVDLGCGTGNFVLALAERGRSGLGLDLSAGMLDRAEHKRRAHKYDQVCFAQADFHRPFPLADHSFDGALSIRSIQFFDPSQFFAEVRRVLVGGGHFVIEWAVRDPSERPAASTMPIWHRWFHNTKRVVARVGFSVGLGAHHPENRVVEALENLGFTVLERRDFGERRGLLCEAPSRPVPPTDRIRLADAIQAPAS